MYGVVFVHFITVRTLNALNLFINISGMHFKIIFTSLANSLPQ